MKPVRAYGEGWASGPRSPLLDAWVEACRVEEQARQRGQWVRMTMAAVARVACEEALANARRN